VSGVETSPVRITVFHGIRYTVVGGVGLSYGRNEPLAHAPKDAREVGLLCVIDSIEE